MTRYLEIKPGSISETIKRLSDDYQAIFKKELEKTGKGIGSMTPDEKKAFFNKIDKMHNAKNEAIAPVKPDDSKTTLVAAPGNKEKVIRIPKEKLADYKAKGYVEAESYIPEAKKIDELTAGQKKLPPALQKAIKAKEKKEEVKLEENISQVTTKKNGADTDIFYKGKHIGYFHKITSQYGEGKIGNYFVYHDNEDDAEDFTQSDEVSSEAQAKKIAYDTAKFNGLIEDKDSGGTDALRAIKGKRQRLQQELDALNKDDTNYKEKAANLRGQIEKQKEIMASKQKEVYGSYDPSREDALDLNEITDEEEKNYARQITSLSNDKVMARINKKGDEAIAAIQAKIDSIKSERDKKKDQKNEEVETVEEAAGADQLTNLNDKITRMQMNLSKLDMAKPESKTKEAIIKSDLTTAKLRLQDLMQKRNKETEKPMNEAKKTYKSMKKSVKKEEETPKKTMTDKPLTKIDVDPKLPTH